MKCDHHPDYDPANGEPTGIVITIDPAEGWQRDCTRCWQVRARFLEKKLTVRMDEEGVK